MDRSLNEFIDELKSNIASLVYSDGEASSFEDKFTENTVEVLESIGQSEGATILSYIHPNKMGGIDWKINGFGLRDKIVENRKELYETLDLFITFYKNDSYDYNITKDDFNKSLNQVQKFIKKAVTRNLDPLDDSHKELNELIKIIGKQGDEFERINIYFLINGFSKHTIEQIEIRELNIQVHIWDISRLYKIHQSNSEHEIIELDFLSNGWGGLDYLEVPLNETDYECYLSIIPGNILADLYKEYSSELLESNVRAFLGQAGKFNKGIRDTIQNKPHMFLPYNNGLTTTAASVTLDRNSQKITHISDFQIVNGGQTTASLYYTRKKNKDIDLSNIFVQMKLTVIKDSQIKDLEVPNISRYANSQNKVSELDLSSNNPFFKAVEQLSRKKYVTNPENNNLPIQWYFERTKGQYKESLNKLTKAEENKFKQTNPTSNKFGKSDIAKFINLWEQKPHVVSQGSQKSFISFTKDLTDSKIINQNIGENFYRKLIANAIIFKVVNKLYGRKNVDAIGDTNLKSFVVSYTISYFNFLSQNRLDLWKIYSDQVINDDLQNIFKYILKQVYSFLTSYSQDKLISEVAKREKTWSHMKESLNLSDDIINEAPSYFLSIDKALERSKAKDITASDSNDEIFIVSKMLSLGIRFWDGLTTYLTNNDLENLDPNKVADIFSRLKNKKKLMKRDITIGANILKMIDEDTISISSIQTLSNLQDKIEPIELKYMHDQLILWNKKRWTTAILLGEKEFDRLEVLNLKSVSNLLLKNNTPDYTSIIKAYHSLSKLNKFGIKI